LKGDGTIVEQNLLAYSTAAGQFFTMPRQLRLGRILQSPGIAFDAAGNMYVADSDTPGWRWWTVAVGPLRGRGCPASAGMRSRDGG
jgi:hypothetical protein